MCFFIGCFNRKQRALRNKYKRIRQTGRTYAFSGEDARKIGPEFLWTNLIG
jgi:hypothetical protein